MKKLFLLSALLLMGCADADTAPLGNLGLRYRPISIENVSVYYGQIPQNCQQVGMSILTASPVSGDLESEIEELREEAALLGGNYVNIDTYKYSAGLFNANAWHMTGTIYRCSK